ncbi:MULTISPECIES: MFS transporter [unclassified Pseudomonas]|uniref:MFS transporter n=1 Tax=unclassified Pseudomonas TaxID=196821 RepID=UPI0015A2B151|nr:MULTISPECIES: MFS transporter [unclassified Pseudomonas]NWC93057.1 MFS transporter [Pseudomonas sp. IPO3779]NWD19475.1 MFS transporter [Pseudomonas sp. IPO3778]
MNINLNVMKWRVLTGCFLSYMFDALDVLVLIICLPAIKETMQISTTQAGLMVTATLLGIGVSSLVMGGLADTLGRRKALLLSLATFGVLTIAIAGATDWKQILVLRFLAGLGLGGVWGTVAAQVNEAWPPHQRARATAFVLSSFSIGSGLAAVLAACFLKTYGWRVLFVISGVLVVIPIIYVWLRVPESAVWLAERKASRDLLAPRNAVTIKALFAADLLRKTLLGTTASALALTAYWGAMTWLPTFLVQEHGLEPSTMAGFIAVMNVGTFIGYNLFGWLADRIGKRRTIIICLIGCGLMLPIYTFATDKTALLLLGPAFAFFIAFAGVFGSYFAELYPTHLRASGAGFCFNVGRGISAFAPLLLGSVALSVGFSISIGFCGALFLLAAAVIFLLPQDVAPHPAYQSPRDVSPAGESI